jgi:hypothetical protein
VDLATVDRVINAVPKGWSIVAVTVPTRALRVVVEETHLKFRVEQLDPTDWSWRAISTHSGDDAWESLGPAIQDAINKQSRLREKIKLAQHEKRMAMIKAENPYGQ